MLTSFDWIRRCKTGAELIATIEYLAGNPDLFSHELVIGPPFSALAGPCPRCLFYAPVEKNERNAHRYCHACWLIVMKAASLGKVSRQSVVIWGYVNQLPRHLESGEGFYREESKGHYVHDQQHFLLILRKKGLHRWMQELALYHGSELKGHLQIFPTTGYGGGIDMGEMICRAVHHEARFTMDQLRVRFYSAPHQLFRPRDRDRQGILTFEAADFSSLLEMAMVFKTLIYPKEQEMLYKLLHLQDPAEKQFYWGRFWGYLHQEAKDMLTAWGIRHWPEQRVNLLYELIEYVVFEQTY